LGRHDPHDHLLDVVGYRPTSDGAASAKGEESAMEVIIAKVSSFTII
jgi:hypothetical protein